MTAYARRDPNHGPLKRALLAARVHILDTADKHGLGWDIMGVHVKTFTVELVEVKKPGWKERDLTESEKAARETFGRHWHVATTEEEILRVFGINC